MRSTYEEERGQIDAALKMFHDIGVVEKDARVYLYLAKKGPSKASDISRTLRTGRVQIYRSLKNLQKRAWSNPLWSILYLLLRFLSRKSWIL